MIARRVLAVACWVFVAAIVLQVFLAGAGLFEMTDYTLHAGLGWLLSLAPVLLFVLALLAHVDRTTRLLALGLLIVAMIQPELAAARDDAPIVAAFHPVNALLIVFMAWTLARRATALARSGGGQASAAGDVAIAD